MKRDMPDCFEKLILLSYNENQGCVKASVYVHSSLFRENGYANEIRYPATAAGPHVHERNVNMLHNQQ